MVIIENTKKYKNVLGNIANCFKYFVLYVQKLHKNRKFLKNSMLLFVFKLIER